MTAPAISPAPWDLRSGEKWEIRSADRDQYGDHNSEVVVDAKGNVVAYVSGFNDEGGNGQLLRAAPALAMALRELSEAVKKEGMISGRIVRAIEDADAMLKRAGL